MKTFHYLIAGVCAGVAYIDLVGACFAGALGLRDIAFSFVACGVVMVACVFLHVRLGNGKRK